MAARVILCCLLVASTVAGDTKRVQSPTRLVSIPVEATSGVDVDWEAADPLDLEIKTFRTVDGYSVAVFYLSGNQAIVRSDLIDWERRRREKHTWIVTPPPGPGPGPGPDPPPDPQPDVSFGIEEVARAALSKVRTHKHHAAQMATNFDAAASAIAAGGVSNEDAARVMIQQANRRVLGDETQEAHIAWKPWLFEVGDAVAEVRNQGKIRTVKDYGLILAEIARGLR